MRLAQRLGVKVGDRIAVGESTLDRGRDRAAGARGGGRGVRAGSQAAAQPRRRAGDQSAAAGQPRDVSAARGRSRRRGTPRGLSRVARWRRSSAGQRMETVRDLRPEVRQTLERAEQFLGLAALVAVLLAAVAVALAASRYLRRHLDAAAMLRCLGAQVRTDACAVLRAVPGAGASLRAPPACWSRSRASNSWWCCCHRSLTTDVAGAIVDSRGHLVRDRHPAAVRLRAAAADRAGRRAAAARAAPRPAATARGRAARLRRWARSPSRC